MLDNFAAPGSSSYSEPALTQDGKRHLQTQGQFGRLTAHLWRGRGGPMQISFNQRLFWIITALGFVLSLIHAALLARWPEVSPLYKGFRPFAARVLPLAEYCLLLAAFVIGVGAVFNLASTKPRQTTAVVAVVGGYAAYFLFFAWVMRMLPPHR